METYIYNNHLLGKSRISDLIIGIDIPQIIVINLSSRIDRKIRVIKDMQKYALPFSFFTAEPHFNSVRGCLESHISIVKWAKSNGYGIVCIFEDDVLIEEGCELINTPAFPNNWDMVYLGGLCTEVREQCVPKSFNKTHNMFELWVKGRIYCNHAYLINHTVYDKIIDEGWNYNKELDRFYTTEIHGNDKYNCYTSSIQRAKQYADWSDIDKKDKWVGYNWPTPGDAFYIP